MLAAPVRGAGTGAGASVVVGVDVGADVIVVEGGAREPANEVRRSVLVALRREIPEPNGPVVDAHADGIAGQRPLDAGLRDPGVGRCAGGKDRGRKRGAGAGIASSVMSGSRVHRDRLPEGEGPDPGRGRIAAMGERIHLIKGDITTATVDVIVNAANAALCGGGGVDGAIHRAAGPALLAYCRTLGGARPGDVVLSPAFNLKATHIAHAVGPVWRDGDSGEDELLAACYRKACELASQQNATSIAFPSISTGAYKFPLDRAARIAIDTVARFLANHSSPGRVEFHLYSDTDLRAYHRALSRGA